MNKEISSKLLRWAEDEKGQTISAGALTLNDVVAIAAHQEVRDAKEGKQPSPKLNGLPDVKPRPKVSFDANED